VTKPRLAISFSGGESSAVMSMWCYLLYGDTHDIRATFVNTGCEHEETLRFVRDCDTHIFKGTLDWIEAVTNGPRKGPTAVKVTYETASRNGEPFEAAIRKHGVFGPTHPQCTSRLKTEPMLWWRKQNGWPPKTYDTAVGIRADEIDRVSAQRERDRIVYPLIQAGFTKQHVNDIMSELPWRLRLPGEHYGNCTWCWKKSKRKLLTLAKDSPEVFDFPKRMEAQYGHTDVAGTGGGKHRTFFRGNLSACDLIQLANTTQFDPYVPKQTETMFDPSFDPNLDVGGGCGESCEIGAD
jgi:hypothetical protein